MAKVYALFVGVNHYARARWTDLGGCVNDIEAGRRWLEERLDTPPDIRVLTDRDATVDAVSTAITRHLGKAGPGDKAFLWFSGHGTEYDAVSRAETLIEATGKCQALVCADGPLPDKRLGVLLDGIAARGAHVAAVLACCFSGGATRDPLADPRAVARYAPPLPEWSTFPEHAPPPPSGAARDTTAPATGEQHVLLGACRLNQGAYEGDYGGRTHGIFAHALLNALRAAPPGATYREVLAAAHARVQGDQRFQHPVLAPPEPGGIADTPVLGGAVRPPAPHLLRYGADGWEVDCGGVHGLREGDDDARGTAFAVTGDHGGPVVRARAVHPTRTLVTPDGWAPDRARAHPVTPSSLALPPLAVRLEGPDAQAVAAPAHRRRRRPGRAAARRHRRRPGPRPVPRRLTRRGPAAAHRPRRRPARRPLPRPPRALATAVRTRQPGITARGPGARRSRPLGPVRNSRPGRCGPVRDRGTAVPLHGRPRPVAPSGGRHPHPQPREPFAVVRPHRPHRQLRRPHRAAPGGLRRGSPHRPCLRR
ncbi:caspase family protein [Streptomyces thermolilacinus]|uniref:caspase family protein n=1 Tax=Streptomyces thermolilacinus TaxID=285540 RepID=UPI0033F538B1